MSILRHMKKSILFIATLLSATLLTGCEWIFGHSPITFPDPYKVEFEASSLIGDYYGDYYGIGKGNYYIYLSDKGLTEDGEFYPHARYYVVDITSSLVGYYNDTVNIPSGTYTLDTEGSLDYKTFSQERSMYIATDYSGNVYMSEPFDSAQMTIDIGGITLTAKIGDYTHTVTYNGSPRVRNMGENGKHSTLDEELALALDNHTLYYYPCGDYYATGIENYMLLLWPNSGDGDIVQFDIMTSMKQNGSLYGTYTIGTTSDEWCFLKGALTVENNETYMEGSWYYTSDYADIAPFVGGTLNVVDNGDGTTTVTFEVIDDHGNIISGTWSGTMELYPY